MRRQYIAVLTVLLLCLAAVPGAAASWGGPAEAAAERLRSIEPAPPGAQKGPSEGTSDGGTVRYAQEASGPGQAELRLTVPEQPPKAGETFTVTVDIVGNPGFATLQLNLPFDKNDLECTSANPGELLNKMIADGNPAADDSAIIVAISLEETKGDGRLAVFSFTAKRDLSTLDFQLTDIEFYDGDLQQIPYTVTKTVTKSPPPPEKQKDLDAVIERQIEDIIRSGGQFTPGDTLEEEPAGEQPAPAETASPKFTDISGHWAEADILRAAELGLIGGYADGTFKPDNSLTRAQFVTILYRQAGRPAVTAATPFTDIANVNDEFRTAIAWAYEKRLVDGTTPTTFNPNGPLSRQATMKILFQHSGAAVGPELMFYSVYDGAFPDSGKLAEWARAPMYWGVYNTLIEAGEDGALHPADTMTRARLARAMVRYMDKFGGDETR